MEISGTCVELVQYLLNMKARDRLVVPYKDCAPIGWLTYMITNWGDTKRLHERTLFSVVEENTDGKVIYIDYVASVCWNREVREAVYSALKAKHPSVQRFVWYRPTKTVDRIVTREGANGKVHC